MLAVPTYAGLELVDHLLELLRGLANVGPEHQHHVPRHYLLEHGHPFVGLFFSQELQRLLTLQAYI